MSATSSPLQIMWVVLLLLFRCALCIPPEDPIKCAAANNRTCTVTNSYGAFPDRTTCTVAEVAYPTSEKDVISIVAAATAAGRKMKVATRYSHSIPKLVCPENNNEPGLVISTKYLNRVLKVDMEGMSMSVESGVTLRQVIEEAGRAGLALPYAPYWWGLTVGGLMATGAHGSTLWGARGSSVHDYADEIRIVTPAAPHVRVLKSGDPNLDAVKVSLGVLGVITQVTLKLELLFKRSITYATKNDAKLGDEATSFGNKNEFGDIIWYPSQRKAVYRLDNRVPLNASGNGLYDFIPFRSTLSAATGLIRITEENQESMNDSVGKCSSAKLITSALITAAYGLTNNGVMFTGYPVVGYHNRLQSSGTCLDSPQDGRITACPWDSRIKGEFFHQTTFSIGLSKASNFIQDVQKLVAIEPRSLCGVELYNGILMRYVQASTAYLGKQEDAIDFDITYYRSKDPLMPRLFEDFLEEIEQIAFFKYGALPHWGKNRNLAFKGVIGRYGSAAKFFKVKQEYDPLGLFSSEWTDRVLGLRDDDGLIVDRDGCALEGLCICSKDTHCAPTKSYYCRPGKVFTQARVCTRVVSNL